jgi:hypothetical protein
MTGASLRKKNQRNRGAEIDAGNRMKAAFDDSGLTGR